MQLKYVLLSIIFSLSFLTNADLIAQCSVNKSGCNSCTVENSTDKTNISNSSDDEFEEFDSSTDSKTSVENVIIDKNKSVQKADITDNYLFVPVIAILLSVLSGFLIKFKRTRGLRIFVITGSLIYFGFVLGGCPCPVSSFFGIFLFPFDETINWQALVWIASLIPVTYVFGKVWCGWVCHLGGLQEFLFRGNKFPKLNSAKVQKIMKISRIIILIFFVLYTIFGRTNLFCQIDPFKAIFNFTSPYLYVWFLAALLIISSMFINRPFCRAVCPIGIVLGWVQMLPGAKRITKNQDCRTCRIQQQVCPVSVLEKSNSNIKIKTDDCIYCGECFDTCINSCKIKKDIV